MQITKLLPNKHKIPTENNKSMLCCVEAKQNYPKTRFSSYTFDRTPPSSPSPQPRKRLVWITLPNRSLRPRTGLKPLTHRISLNFFEDLIKDPMALAVDKNGGIVKMEQYHSIPYCLSVRIMPCRSRRIPRITAVMIELDGGSRSKGNVFLGFPPKLPRLAWWEKWCQNFKSRILDN